jgi:mono/diheme cytochrome c family protein
MKVFILAFAIIGVVVVAAAALTSAGYYDVAADGAHWGVTRGFIVSTRERSIARQARGVGTPPALDDPALLAMGAEHYDEMCVSCHLAPGMDESEIRAGLNPRPPKLAARGMRRSPQQDFWIIKHGFKMTAMPAWGATHDDRSIWAMAAFLQKLPGLSRADYDALVASGRAAGHSDAETAGHSHEEAEPADDHSKEDTEPHHDH